MPRSLRLVAHVVAGLGVGLTVIFALLHLVGGWRILAIASDSMEPAIARGDVVLVRPVAAQDITNGDVILFAAGEQTRVEVVHRVSSVVTINLSVAQQDGTLATTSQRVFRTKGDANPAPDTWQVDARNLQGRAYAVLPGLGWPLLDYPVASIFGVLAAALGAAWAVYELALARRRRAVRVEAAVPIATEG